MSFNSDRAITARFFAHDPMLHVSSCFYTLQGEGQFIGHPAVFLRLAGCNFGAKDPNGFCPFCFPSEASITTPFGKRKFSDVEVGDQLYTLSPEGEVVLTTVQRTLNRVVPQDELISIRYTLPGTKSVKTVVCTREHPFNTTRGFIPAGKLKLSDVIYHAEGNALKAVSKTVNNGMFRKATVKRMKATTLERRASGEIKPAVRTDEQKAKYSASKLGDLNPMKRHEVRLKNALSHTYQKSGLEKLFHTQIMALRLGFRYCGNNGKLVVGDDEAGYRLPDFYIPGTNKVVEIYSTTFSQYKEGRRTVKNYEVPTRKFYASFGYEVLFLTDADIPKTGKGIPRSKSAWEPVRQKIGMFVRNGAQIVSLKPVTRQQYENLGGTSAGIEVTNFSCAPYNTFLVGGLHTHNCDTSFQIDRAKKLTPEHTADLVCDVLGGSSAELLVITGGEPTLQQNIVQVLRILHERNMFSMFQFETNGTNPAFLQHIENLPAELRSKVTFCVSPKASYKTKEYARINPRMWSMLAASRGFVKFVVSADPDSPHHKLPEWVSELAEDFIPVYVSPMTVYKREPQGEVSSVWNRELVDHEATAKNYEYAAAYVMAQSGLLFTCQTHLFTAIP